MRATLDGDHIFETVQILDDLSIFSKGTGRRYRVITEQVNESFQNSHTIFKNILKRILLLGLSYQFKSAFVDRHKK